MQNILIFFWMRKKNIGVFYVQAIFHSQLNWFLLKLWFPGIVGSAITYAVIPKNRHGMLGALQPASGVDSVQAFFVELILTVILLFTVFSSTSDDNGRKDFGFANALAIGLAVTVAHLVGVSEFLILSFSMEISSKGALGNISNNILFCYSLYSLYWRWYRG